MDSWTVLYGMPSSYLKKLSNMIFAMESSHQFFLVKKLGFRISWYCCSRQLLLLISWLLHGHEHACLFPGPSKWKLDLLISRVSFLPNFGTSWMYLHSKGRVDYDVFLVTSNSSYTCKFKKPFGCLYFIPYLPFLEDYWLGKIWKFKNMQICVWVNFGNRTSTGLPKRIHKSDIKNMQICIWAIFSNHPFSIVDDS